jgi:hypothetical protein
VPDKALNDRADAHPNGVCRAVDHLGGEDGVDSECGQNGRAASFLLLLVSAPQPLAREENGRSARTVLSW